MVATIISKNKAFKSYTLERVLSVSTHSGDYGVVVLVFKDDDDDIKTTTYNMNNVKIHMDVC